jgi:hypothetical protein
MSQHPFDYDPRAWSGRHAMAYEVVLALATGLFVTAVWMLTS